MPTAAPTARCLALPAADLRVRPKHYKLLEVTLDFVSAPISFPILCFPLIFYDLLMWSRSPGIGDNTRSRTSRVHPMTFSGDPWSLYGQNSSNPEIFESKFPKRQVLENITGWVSNISIVQWLQCRKLCGIVSTTERGHDDAIWSSHHE